MWHVILVSVVHSYAASCDATRSSLYSRAESCVASGISSCSESARGETLLQVRGERLAVLEAKADVAFLKLEAATEAEVDAEAQEFLAHDAHSDNMDDDFTDLGEGHCRIINKTSGTALD